MKPRILLSVLISLALVGGVTWYRFKSSEPKNTGIVSVDDPTIVNIGDIQGINTRQLDQATNPDGTPLTKSDQLGRNMITDYVNLAANGAATEDSVTNLANQYVETVKNLNAPTVITLADIKSVPNTKTNFVNYANSIQSILTEHGTKIVKTYPNGSVTSFGPELYTLTKDIGNAYNDAAIKLKNTPTPIALLNSHLKLINLYFASANAMLSITNTDRDSSAAFAGIITMNDNLDKETAAVNEINQILIKNGI